MARFQKQQLSAGIILALLIALAFLICGCAVSMTRNPDGSRTTMARFEFSAQDAKAVRQLLEER